MTVTLNLKPEVEAGLLAQAKGAGMSLEEYLLSMVEGAVEGAVEGVILPAMPRIPSPEQRAAAFEAWSASHRVTPPLSD